MAIWRNRDLEAIVGGPLDAAGFDEAGLAKLVDEIPAESEFVDYKSRLAFEKVSTDPKQWVIGQERAKDICAAANGRGGVLVFGVEDIRKVSATADRMQPFDASCDSDALIEHYRRDIRTFTTPTPLYDVFRVDAEAGGFYLVVVIPPSIAAPHAVLAQRGENRKALHYVIRTAGEANIRYLDEYEVADQYSRRLKLREDRSRHIEQVWTDGCREILDAQDQGSWIAMSIVPDAQLDTQLTRELRVDIEEWGDSTPLHKASVLGSVQWVPDYAFPAPGKVEFKALRKIGDQDTPTVASTYRELHVDGSAYAAYRLAEGGPRDEEVEVNVDYLIDVIAAMAQVMMGWTLYRVGAWGNATLTTGIFDHGGERLARPLHLNNSGGESARGLRKVVRSQRFSTIVQLDDVASVQDRLRVAYRAGAPIVQMFGITEPNWITDTGALRDWNLLGPLSRRACEWAHSNGVEVDTESVSL